jgi:hypothetical protein
MDISSKLVASKENHEIHKRALTALTHYYKHRDSMLLTRVMLSMPKSNRRVALYEWIRKFSVLRWDRVLERLVRSKKIGEHQDLDGASQIPFWTLKVKQVQRRHVSGNTFESDLFFERVIADIEANIERVSVVKLELTILTLQKIVAQKHAGTPPQK